MIEHIPLTLPVRWRCIHSLSPSLPLHCCPLLPLLSSLSLSLLASSVFCWCCVMPPHSTGSQDLLYSCCIVLLLFMCVGREEATRQNMFCLCVCVRMYVYKSCSPLLPWQRRAHGSGSFAAQHCQSRAAGRLFLSVVEKFIHTKTPLSMWISDRQTDGQTLTQTKWIFLSSQ